jgi:ABC-type uncharacterized transport system fused permease/ATPase subunit
MSCAYPAAAAAACRQFTDAALGLSLTILNSLIDLVSFSGILYSIYPPLFAALLAYSIGGTVGSIALGKVGRLSAVCSSVLLLQLCRSSSGITRVQLSCASTAQ